MIYQITIEEEEKFRAFLFIENIFLNPYFLVSNVIFLLTLKN
ncbi:MAG: hypothetical protein MRERC_3c012 [Mycoplasmataceae bacterium RC_NB112A]|nr:MAG: hypothetical protein MRERC_9c075 [Mycoplasmataceae bacterium RC_NB112A]KLL02191.1 MAG: hypothetical protein MRERC_3c012 [Mycoplasmataceae bacterium RC_NB112A]